MVLFTIISVKNEVIPLFIGSASAFLFIPKDQIFYFVAINSTNSIYFNTIKILFDVSRQMQTLGEGLYSCNFVIKVL